MNSGVCMYIDTDVDMDTDVYIDIDIAPFGMMEPLNPTGPTAKA